MICLLLKELDGRQAAIILTGDRRGALQMFGLLRSFEDGDARIEIFRFGVEAGSGQQLLGLSVIEIDVPVPGTAKALGHKDDEAAVLAKSGRVFVRRSVQAGQRQVFASAAVEEIDVAAALATWPLGGEGDQVAVGA